MDRYGAENVHCKYQEWREELDEHLYHHGPCWYCKLDDRVCGYGNDFKVTRHIDSHCDSCRLKNSGEPSYQSRPSKPYVPETRYENPNKGYYCSQCTKRDSCSHCGGSACGDFTYDM